MFQTLIMFVMILNTIMFTQMKHPMTMGMTLLTQTFMICLMTGVSKTFWFSYMLFLIFIGGMLILFIYMSSLSPNEKINLTLNKNFKLMVMMIFIPFIAFTDKLYLTPKSYNNDMLMMVNSLFKENTLLLSKIYDSPNSFITLMMILYLLLTLIVIVKITNSFMGPLRSKT